MHGYAYWVKKIFFCLFSLDMSDLVCYIRNMMKLKVNKFSYLAYVIAGVKLLEVTITKIVAGHAPGMDPIKNIVFPGSIVPGDLNQI